MINEVLISGELWQHFVYHCAMLLLSMHFNTSCMLTIHLLVLTNLAADTILLELLNFECLAWSGGGGGGRNTVDFEVITF